jgi:hypothetical protein
MNWRVVVGAVFVVLLLPHTTTADVSYRIIEYRVLTDLGQVRLTTGFVHEPAIQERIIREREQFERRGILFGFVESEHRFSRKETIGSHSIETVIVLYPPVGSGFGGGMPTAHITISVDGVNKVDCPYDDAKTDVTDIAVLVPDGMIWFRGSRNDKPVDSWIPLSGAKAINLDWLDRGGR